MATAEQLLNEAQYAFQSIGFGESRENTRNASRANSLCNKIIRRFPTSNEAAEAHAILRRLGEEAYSSELTSQHQHASQNIHHRQPRSAPDLQRMATRQGELETLNWSGLISWLSTMPKIVLFMIAFAGFFLFGFLGPFLLVPLVAFVLLTGPFRQMLKPEQRKELDAFIVRANNFITKQRNA
ncbi:MAG: hypothetical protein ACR2QI_03630 [Woeseiaceae bacterium]